MDPQKRAGIKIAETRTIVERKGYWVVPQGKNPSLFYIVHLTRQKQKCDCDTFQELASQARRRWCRHLYAVRHILKKRKEKKVPLPPAKKTFPRSWANYNLARAAMHEEFKNDLFQFCQELPQHQQSPKGGRPKVPLADLVYASVMKIRTRLAAKLLESFLKKEQEAGRLVTVPSASAVLDFFNSAAACEILDRFIGQCCLPLRQKEVDFAVDSTHFQAPRIREGYSAKRKKVTERRETVKAHIFSGIRTNVIAGIRVTPDHGKGSGDSPQFAHLLAQVVQRFKVARVFADSAYSGRRNCDLTEEIGAEFVPNFRKNAKVSKKKDEYDTILGFKLAFPDEYNEKYTKRSKVESVHSTLKRSARRQLFSKSDESMKAEVMCMALIHNMELLIRLRYGA